MIEVDEVALIEFFGVAPEPQSQEESEFFAAPLFIKRVAGLELQVSISAHFRELRVTMRQPDCDPPVLELVVPNIVSVSIDRDTPRPWLRVTSETHGVTWIAVEPTITVKAIHKES